MCVYGNAKWLTINFGTGGRGGRVCLVMAKRFRSTYGNSESLTRKLIVHGLVSSQGTVRYRRHPSFKRVLLENLIGMRDLNVTFILPYTAAIKGKDDRLQIVSKLNGTVRA